MKFFNKRNAKKLQIVGLLAGVVLGLGSMLGSPAADAAVSFGGPFDCDANAVLYCGGKNTSVINTDYKNGVKGSNGSTKVNDTAASIHNIYGMFNITSSDVQNLSTTAVAGTVNKNGKVYIGSHLVATDAVTAGRQNISGSTKVTYNGTTFYTRKPSVSFSSTSLTAYVVMKNGQFQFAILSSCGNPVRAIATKPQAGQLACTELLVTPGKVESNGNQYYDLTAKASATNATITQYVFNYGGNTGSETLKTSAKSVDAGQQMYAPGTYKVSVTISGKANGSMVTAPKPATCSKSITIAKPTTTPPAGTLTCNSLTLTPISTSSTNGDVSYTLTAETSTSNATISKYVFTPGNGSADQTFQTNATKVTTQPIVYSAGKAFSSIFVTVYGMTSAGKALTAGGAGSSCATNLTVPAQTCATGSQSSTCKPTCTAPNGQTYPANSSQCAPQTPTTPTAPITTTAIVTTPTQLANTGPGDIIGLFAAVSAVAGFGYHFFARRFNRGL